MKQPMFTLLKSARTNGVRSTLDFTNFAVLWKITVQWELFRTTFEITEYQATVTVLRISPMPLTSLTYAVAIEN